MASSESYFEISVSVDARSGRSGFSYTRPGRFGQTSVLRQGPRLPRRLRAPAISIFFIFSIAAMTRCDFSRVGVAEQLAERVSARSATTRRTGRSASRTTRSSPPSPSASQNRSTSSCDSQFTWKEIASVKGNSGPPFNAMNCWPSSLKSHRHHEALFSRTGGAVAGDLDDPRVLENPRVDLRRVLAFVVQRQAGSHLLHCSSSIGVSFTYSPPSTQSSL